MSDPAVEAARRARVHFTCAADPWAMEAAVREALKPIRAKCEELDRLFGDSPTNVAVGVRKVLQDLAPLIYASKEVDRD